MSSPITEKISSVTGPYPDLSALQHALATLEEKMNQAVEKQGDIIAQVHPEQRMSAENLVRYLALRSEDIRSLQDALHIAGVSSMASCESHVLRQVQAIRERLGKNFAPGELSGCDYYVGQALIHGRATMLFGGKEEAAIPYLMVTLDAEFVDDLPLVKDLLQAGMSVARINCAHDNEAIWENMIQLVRKASEETGLPCKIYMDLVGPKLRTTILGKGRLLGKIPLAEGQRIKLAEATAEFPNSDVVIGCNEPHVVRQLQQGRHVFFDDGLIESKVIDNTGDIATLEITRISSKKPRLKKDKGINFPDVDLQLPALTEHDYKVLPFVCKHADLVGYSFARDNFGVAALQKVLKTFPRQPHIIIKIETPDAVKNFPSLLLQGMKDDVFGVMIARGDLAVEIGFERMSEIQEEIIWISEAAHVPVIWATQVLENLNKSGIATRSEVTDASYAAMAECVMINKGSFVINVMKTLKDILRRSGAHHTKKRYTFRPMQIAIRYLTGQ